MVKRHIADVFVSFDDSRGEEGLTRIPVTNRELLRRFSEFCDMSTGDFECILKDWVEERKSGGHPLDYNDPESQQISESLQGAMRGAFNKSKKKKKKPRR
jgi:hypothetical protein